LGASGHGDRRTVSGELDIGLIKNISGKTDPLPPHQHKERLGQRGTKGSQGRSLRSCVVEASSGGNEMQAICPPPKKIHGLGSEVLRRKSSGAGRPPVTPDVTVCIPFLKAPGEEREGMRDVKKV